MSFNISVDYACEIKKKIWIDFSFTCQSLSHRDGRVHSVSSSDPARSDGGQIRGGNNAGHGHLPICGFVEGDNTTLLNLQSLYSTTN